MPCSPLFSSVLVLFFNTRHSGPFCKTLSGEVGILIKDYYYLGESQSLSVEKVNLRESRLDVLETLVR